jgi:hypothetical protein
VIARGAIERFENQNGNSAIFFREKLPKKCHFGAWMRPKGCVFGRRKPVAVAFRQCDRLLCDMSESLFFSEIHKVK